VREIAASMRLSEGAVKFHLHAARTALRDRLETP
jgi:DNA-directed RNA polymerase specialized sigma24 family protein